MNKKRKKFYALEKLRKKSRSSLWGEKDNEVLTTPTTPSPKLFGNTYPFEQKSEKNNETATTLQLSTVPTTTAYSSRVKPFVPKAKSVMDAKKAKEKELKKRPGFKDR